MESDFEDISIAKQKVISYLEKTQEGFSVGDIKTITETLDVRVNHRTIIELIGEGKVRLDSKLTAYLEAEPHGRIEHGE